MKWPTIAKNFQFNPFESNEPNGLNGPNGFYDISYIRKLRRYVWTRAAARPFLVLVIRGKPIFLQKWRIFSKNFGDFFQNVEKFFKIWRSFSKYGEVYQSFWEVFKGFWEDIQRIWDWHQDWLPLEAFFKMKRSFTKFWEKNQYFEENIQELGWASGLLNLRWRTV